MKMNSIKTAVLAVILSFSQLIQAGDRIGNGGSGNESAIAAQQALIENISFKLRNFFKQNEEKLEDQFPEFVIRKLLSKIREADIRVVDVPTLTDRHGVSRTCLNFPESSAIECKLTGLLELSEKQPAIFVLVFHEYLGLLGVEETSPSNPNVIDGYSISKRIAPYVTKVNDYDLVIREKIIIRKKCSIYHNVSTVRDPDVKVAKKLKQNGFTFTDSAEEAQFYLNQVYTSSYNGVNGPTLVYAVDIENKVTNGKTNYQGTSGFSLGFAFSNLTQKLPTCEK